MASCMASAIAHLQKTVHARLYRSSFARCLGGGLMPVTVKVCFVGRPRQSIHPRGGIAFEREERHPQAVDADVVEECGEPLLLPLPCGLPYALQRLCHALPSLCPVRALLARVPLGPRPWLHRLRCGRDRFVRRLHSYYGRV